MLASRPRLGMIAKRIGPTYRSNRVERGDDDCPPSQSGAHETRDVRLGSLREPFDAPCPFLLIFMPANRVSVWQTERQTRMRERNSHQRQHCPSTASRSSASCNLVLTTALSHEQLLQLNHYHQKLQYNG